MKTSFLLLWLSHLAFGNPTPWVLAHFPAVPMHQCVPSAKEKNRFFCVSNGRYSTFETTSFFEVRFKGTQAERRNHLELFDSSMACEGKELSHSTFYGFESRDADGDGQKDVIVLVRAGKAKRKPTQEDPCAHPNIGTAIYELDYLDKPTGFELFEPSDLIRRRLGNLGALNPLEQQKIN